MRLPRRVKVGPYVYTVSSSPEKVAWAEKREGKGTRLDGYISFRHECIVVNKKDCDVTNVQYTLAHEIVHGILDVIGYGKQWMAEHGDESYEEAFVDRFSSAWLNVIRDNPALLRFLEAK